MQIPQELWERQALRGKKMPLPNLEAAIPTEAAFLTCAEMCWSLHGTGWETTKPPFPLKDTQDLKQEAKG